MSGIQSLILRHSPLPSPLSITAPRTAYASRFTRQPQSQSIIENDAVQFDCEATGPVSDLQYNWLHNGEYNKARETNREREREIYPLPLQVTKLCMTNACSKSVEICISSQCSATMPATLCASQRVWPAAPERHRLQLN